jgi:hypothetical protein
MASGITAQQTPDCATLKSAQAEQPGRKRAAEAAAARKRANGSTNNHY